MGLPKGLITGVTAKLPGADEAPAPRKHKYGATPTRVDGIRFDSKREAERYGELKLLEEAGEIESLQLQPRFQLMAKATVGREKLRAVVYVGDFAYTEDGRQVVEDVKGVETPIWRLKRNMFLWLYPDIELRVVN